jgi:hypothetical protein
MLVYDFVTLDRPFGAVTDSLTVDPGAGPLARAVAAASARLSPTNGDTSPGELKVGAPRAFDGTVVLPIRWMPARGVGPFDELDGLLRIAPFDPDGSHVSLSASCDEPVTGLGRRQDSHRFQRQTEAGVRVLLRELAAAVERELIVGTQAAEPAFGQVDSPPWLSALRFALHAEIPSD